jgi:hypothetical protein
VRSPFLELTVVVNSNHAGDWTALVRRDQIAAIEDVSSRKLTGDPKSRVTLAEPIDLVNIGNSAAAVLRGHREFSVKQDVATINAFLQDDPAGCGCCL